MIIMVIIHDLYILWSRCSWYMYQVSDFILQVEIESLSDEFASLERM